MKPITYGVAQGSPLEQLLFLNDLPNLASCLPRLFTDDTCFVINNELSSFLEIQINEQLSKVLTWCNANKLNPSKSNNLVIPSKLNSQISKSASLKIIRFYHLMKLLNTLESTLTHIKSMEHKFSFVETMRKLKIFPFEISLTQNTLCSNSPVSYI